MLWVLLGVNILMLGMALLFSVAGNGSENISSMLCMPSSPVEFLTRPWTALSYMFLHFDSLHFIFNMACLLFFGGILVRVSSDVVLLRVALISGIAGAAGWLLQAMAGGDTASLCGASAAVSGICGAIVKISPRHRRIALPALILSFAGIGLYGPGVACSHLAGAVAGFMYAACIAHVSSSVPEDSHADADLLRKLALSGYHSLSDDERNRLRPLNSGEHKK